ncbi:MAG: hypothetical protein KDD62_09015 [Bdellovibrionales bacterium]|nr:hypothetical protein [Bdellovibrionales bacterium]
MSEITYSSPGGGAGILRSDGLNTLTLDPNSTLSFSYLDSTGTALTLPMSNSDIANSLSAIQFTLTITATEPLKDGTFYTKTITKIVNLRNLNLIRA